MKCSAELIKQTFGIPAHIQITGVKWHPPEHSFFVYLAGDGLPEHREGEESRLINVGRFQEGWTDDNL